MDDDSDSDRYRHLSEREQRIASLRRDGIEPVDRQGRPRVVLGDGPESRLVIGTSQIRRQRPSLISDHLTLSEWKRMYLAVATANYQGWILNTFVTVSWEMSGASHPEYLKALHDHLNDLLRRWCLDTEASLQSRPKPHMQEQVVPHASIWVREVGAKMGLHSHLLVHVPRELYYRFRGWIRPAVHRLAEVPKPDPRLGPGKKRLVHIAPLASVQDQWGVFRYMMKGVDRDMLPPTMDPSYRQFLETEFPALQLAPQGRIEGARCGASRTLGPSARQRLKASLGLPQMWPDDYDPEGLHFGARFLHDGNLARTLPNITI